MQVEKDFEDIFKILAVTQRVIDAREPMAAGHSERVVHYAEMIAKELGFDENRLKWLKLAALLQDIGKLGIPESILSKPGLLSSNEVEIIKGHVQLSAYVAKEMGFDKIVPWILAHHERWDGKGYPKGLKGEEIPLEARILGLADSIEAMTAPRIYRRALRWNEVRQVLEQGAGKQWDPEIVKIALRAIHGPVEIPEIDYWKFKEVHFLRVESAIAQKRLSVLYELANIVRNSLSVEEAFARIFISLYEQMGYNYLAAFLSPRQHHFELFAALGFPEDIPSQYALSSPKFSRELMEAIRAHVPEFKDTTVIWIRTDSDIVGAVLVGENIFYSLGIVFFRSNGEVSGALLVGEQTDEVFGPEDFKFFESVASHLQDLLKKLPESPQKPLFVDPTTGFYYFPSLSYRLAKKERLSIVYIQIPDYDSLLSSYGSYIADILKRQFAHELRNLLPGIEYWASLSKDEFVAVSSKNTDILRLDLERLRRELQGKAVKIKFEVYELPDFKFGIAKAPEDGSKLPKLIEVAKKRLK